MEIKRMETASIQDAVFLKNDDFLIKHLPDYYSVKKGSGFSSHVPEDDTYNVGVIVSAGMNKSHMNGHVVFYMKKAGTKVHIKGYGDFDLINSDHHSHLVLSNEFVEEYKNQ